MKFFYDHFTNEQIAGLFGWEHLFTIVLFAVLLTVVLVLSRKITEKGLQKLHFWIAVGVTVCEIIKITLRVVKGQGADSYMPLYYCSLFIYGIWLALCKNKALSRTGYAFVCMGGAMAAFCFTAYPSTSLAIFPLWHPATWHSFFYHFVMCYAGILFLWKKTVRAESGGRAGVFYLYHGCVRDCLLLKRKFGYELYVFAARLSVTFFGRNFGGVEMAVYGGGVVGASRRDVLGEFRFIQTV